jgi:hypothetical protein
LIARVARYKEVHGCAVSKNESASDQMCARDAIRPVCAAGSTRGDCARVTQQIGILSVDENACVVCANHIPFALSLQVASNAEPASQPATDAHHTHNTRCMGMDGNMSYERMKFDGSPLSKEAPAHRGHSLHP